MQNFRVLSDHDDYSEPLAELTLSRFVPYYCVSLTTDSHPFAGPYGDFDQ